MHTDGHGSPSRRQRKAFKQERNYKEKKRERDYRTQPSHTHLKEYWAQTIRIELYKRRVEEEEEKEEEEKKDEERASLCRGHSLATTLVDDRERSTSATTLVERLRIAPRTFVRQTLPL